jgi:hypothetical protein
MRTERKPETAYWKLFSSLVSQTSLPSEGQRKHPIWTSLPAPAASHPPVTNWDSPQAMDDHWTAVTAYLADMDFPNEG